METQPQEEIYLPIQGYPRYHVSNLGNVKNIKTDRILRLNPHSAGYKLVNLCDGINKPALKYVHKLVLTAFVPNPEKKRCIDHIDGNRGNNTLSNLRWATYQENNFNKSPRLNSSSGGIKGVTFNKRMQKWQAKITLNRKSIHLGFYNNLEVAQSVRKFKAEELFGPFCHVSERIS